MKSEKKQFMKLFIAALSLAFAFVFCSSSALATTVQPRVKTFTLQNGHKVTGIDLTGGHRYFYQIEEIKINMKQSKEPTIIRLESFPTLPEAKRAAYKWASGTSQNEMKMGMIFHPTPDNKCGRIYADISGSNGGAAAPIPDMMLSVMQGYMANFCNFHM